MNDNDWPEGAVGQLRVRTDRPERLACYDRWGRLQFSLAHDVELHQAIANPPRGFRFDAQGFLFRA